MSEQKFPIAKIAVGGVAVFIGLSLVFWILKKLFFPLLILGLLIFAVTWFKKQ